MHMIKAASIIAATLAFSGIAVGQQQRQPAPPPMEFWPARITQFNLPAATPPNTVAGGEVLIEAFISQTGVVTKAVPLRITPPYTQLMLDAVARWQFQPAMALNKKRLQERVETSVLIAAVYRSAALLNGPTVGWPPKDITSPSAEVPFPFALISPAYPLKTVNVPFGRALFEMELRERGEIQTVRHIAGDAGFEVVSAEALRQWKFRPSTFRGLPATSIAYVFFGFPAPVIIVDHHQ